MRAAIFRIAYRGLFDSSARYLKNEIAAEIGEWYSHVKTHGIHVVKDFASIEACQDAAADIDRLQKQYPTAVQYASRGADLRIFGAENKSDVIKAYAADPKLLALAGAFLGKGAGNAFTLAGNIHATKENLGSGEGWHRDAFFGQFKAILYLTNVTEDNGPFEYVLHSHHFSRKYSDRYRHASPLDTTRVSDAVIQKLCAAEPDRLKTVVGDAGTLILCDTTGIHRGRPMASGIRYALTNYYYPARELTSAKMEEFKPVLGYHVAA